VLMSLSDLRKKFKNIDCSQLRKIRSNLRASKGLGEEVIFYETICDHHGLAKFKRLQAIDFSLSWRCVFDHLFT